MPGDIDRVVQRISEMPHNKVNTKWFWLRGWNTSEFYCLPLANLYSQVSKKNTHIFCNKKGKLLITHQECRFTGAVGTGWPPGEAQALPSSRDVGCSGQTATDRLSSQVNASWGCTKAHLRLWWNDCPPTVTHQLLRCQQGPDPTAPNSGRSGCVTRNAPH